MLSKTIYSLSLHAADCLSVIYDVIKSQIRSELFLTSAIYWQILETSPKFEKDDQKLMFFCLSRILVLKLVSIVNKMHFSRANTTALHHKINSLVFCNSTFPNFMQWLFVFSRKLVNFFGVIETSSTKAWIFKRFKIKHKKFEFHSHLQAILLILIIHKYETKNGLHYVPFKEWIGIKISSQKSVHCIWNRA